MLYYNYILNIVKKNIRQTVFYKTKLCLLVSTKTSWKQALKQHNHGVFNGGGVGVVVRQNGLFYFV